jgi:hypothetical protein
VKYAVAASGASITRTAPNPAADAAATGPGCSRITSGRAVPTAARTFLSVPPGSVDRSTGRIRTRPSGARAATTVVALPTSTPRV